MDLDHVGIVVESIDKALAFYQEALGLVVDLVEAVPSQQVKVAFLKDPVGDRAQIELLEAMGKQGAVAKFLKSHGPGMHHVAFQTSDIGKTMKKWKEAGKPAIENAPRSGARGHQVCFLHPKHAHGVLIELVG